MATVALITGLSGAGKSTICRAVLAQLTRKGIVAAVLDGDEFRASFCQDLGFSREDRLENLRRMSLEADRLSRENLVVLMAAIAPYRSIRAEMRAQHPSFLEIYVDAPLAVCALRDPKGLYQRAHAGKLADFTGVSSPYEEPLSPDIHCRTDRETVDECCAKVVEAIERELFLAGEKIRV